MADLAHAPAQAPQVVPRLVRTLNNEERGDPDAVKSPRCDLLGLGAAAVPALIDNTKKAPYLHQRLESARVLYEIGSVPARAAAAQVTQAVLPDLVRRLAVGTQPAVDSPAFVDKRRAAAQLQILGPLAAPATQALIQAVFDADEKVGYLACNTIREYYPDVGERALAVVATTRSGDVQWCASDTVRDYQERRAGTAKEYHRYLEGAGDNGWDEGEQRGSFWDNEDCKMNPYLHEF